VPWSWETYICVVFRFQLIAGRVTAGTGDIPEISRRLRRRGCQYNPTGSRWRQHNTRSRVGECASRTRIGRAAQGTEAGARLAAVVRKQRQTEPAWVARRAKQPRLNRIQIVSKRIRPGRECTGKPSGLLNHPVRRRRVGEIRQIRKPDRKLLCGQRTARNKLDRKRERLHLNMI